MKRIMVAGGMIALMAGAAQAGGYTAPVVEAAPVVAQPVVAESGDWTGFYAGGQLGYGSSDFGAEDGDGAFGGVHAGYLYDLGRFVTGVEVDYSAADLDFGQGNSIDRLGHIKAIGGIDQGDWLLYGTLGAAYVHADVGGTGYNDVIPAVGLGANYKMSDAWTLGSELMYHKGDDFDGSGQDLEMTTLSMKASFNF